MKIEIPVTDKKLVNFKEELEERLFDMHNAVTTKTPQAHSGTITLKPFIPIDVARYVYYKCTDLRRCITVYAHDTILNEYSLENPDTTQTKKDLINNIWNKDATTWQTYLAFKEYILYGYAALEIIPDKQNKYKLQQIPAWTLELEIKTLTDQKTNRTYQYYYAKQTINGEETLLRLSNRDYSRLDKNGYNDGSVGEVLWIGGGEESDFFDVPLWVDEKENIFTSLAIDTLNHEKIQHGNIPAGVLMFQGPQTLPDPDNPDKPKVDTYIEQELEDNSGGTIVLYLETNSSSRDITMNYQALTDNNYEYFDALQDKCQKQIRKGLGVPSARLLIDTEKESMNSHKTSKLYEIYIEEIRGAQMFIKQIINQFNNKYLNITDEIVISTPEFVDKIDTKIDTITKLFDKGLLTLGQVLIELTDIYPELDLKENLDDEMLNMRFYNGKLLGDNSTSYEDQERYDGIIQSLEEYLHHDDIIA